MNARRFLVVIGCLGGLLLDGRPLAAGEPSVTQQRSEVKAAEPRQCSYHRSVFRKRNSSKKPSGLQQVASHPQPKEEK